MAIIKVSQVLSKFDTDEIIESYKNNNTVINLKFLKNNINEKLSYNIYIKNNGERYKSLDIIIELMDNDNIKKVPTIFQYTANNYYEFTKMKEFKLKNSYMIDDICFKFDLNYDCYIDRAKDFKLVLNNFDFDLLFFNKLLLFNRFDNDYELLETLCAFIMLKDDEIKNNKIDIKFKEKLDYYGYNEDNICKKISNDIGRKAYLLNNTLNEVLRKLYYNEDYSCTVINDTLGILKDYADFLDVSHKSSWSWYY